MKTMICLILDRSGSMQGREKDVIGGVNTFIAEQKKLPVLACIAFVRFDTEAIERFRPMQDLQKIEPLTDSDFIPRGGTPLLDCIGRTITQLDEDWRTEKPERCIVVIVTDGQENSSREFTKVKIAEMIKSREASKLWSFIYLGANVDAFEEAGSMGINVANTAGYTSSAVGTQSVYKAASASVGFMRSSGATVAHNLGGDIAEDGSLKRRPIGGLAETQTPQGSWVPPTATNSATWAPPA